MRYPSYTPVMPEHVSPNIPVPPRHQATVPSVSPDGNTVAEYSSLEQLTLKQISNSFRERVYPAIQRCKDFNLNAPNDPHAMSLRGLFQDPEHRETTWMYLATHGMPWNLTQGQQHALISILAPYIAEDTSCSWGGVFVLTDHSVRTDDMAMYKLLGDTVRSLEIPKDMLLMLGGCFLQCSTHNVSRQPAYTPWMELLLEKSDERMFHLASLELRERVLKGDLSTYDHILTLMCSAQSPNVSNILNSSISPPSLPSKLPEIPLRTFLMLGAHEMMTTLPLSAGVSFLMNGVSGVFSLQTVVSALFVSTVVTATRHRRTFQEMVAHEFQEIEEFLRCPSYLHYADQVYGKLCELLPSRPQVAGMLNAMDQNPVFSQRHEAWKKLRSSVA